MGTDRSKETSRPRSIPESSQKKVQMRTLQMLEHNHGLLPCTWKDQESVANPWERNKQKSNSGHISAARRRRRNNNVLEPVPREPAAIPSTWLVLVHSVLMTHSRGRCCHGFYLINEATEARRGKVSCPRLHSM